MLCSSPKSGILFSNLNFVLKSIELEFFVMFFNHCEKVHERRKNASCNFEDVLQLFSKGDHFIFFHFQECLV